MSSTIGSNNPSYLLMKALVLLIMLIMASTKSGVERKD